jgi:segregation and condensation protein B
MSREFYHSMSDNPLPELSLSARLEALLFVAPGAVTPSQLAAALEISTAEVNQGLAELESLYVAEGPRRGLRLQRHFGRVQLTTAAETALLIERFLGLEASSRLSRAALEALAISAYQQPVTRPQIDAIRGVNSDGVLKSLLSKGLIQEVGRAEAPGRPILYSTTPDFLQYFGLNSLEELPPLGLEELLAPEEEQSPELLKE